MTLRMITPSPSLVLFLPLLLLEVVIPADGAISACTGSPVMGKPNDFAIIDGFSSMKFLGVVKNGKAVCWDAQTFLIPIQIVLQYYININNSTVWCCPTTEMSWRVNTCSSMFMAPHMKWVRCASILFFTLLEFKNVLCTCTYMFGCCGP